MITLALWIAAIYIVICVADDIKSCSDIEKTKKDLYELVDKKLEDDVFISQETKDKIVKATMVFYQIKTAIVAIAVVYLIWWFIKSVLLVAL